LIKDTKKASKFNSLFDLVFRKEYNTIKHLIRNGVSFEIENENKITPLMIAVLKKDFHIIKLLVENGKVKIDKKDFKGQTALNYALNYPGITYSTKIATYLASQCP
jgi:ankyrin repeat protein